MNYLKSTTVIVWHTRNWRHQKRAETYCKDYAMRALHKNCYIGSLYKKEYLELNFKLEKLMNGKSERCHSFVICSSCVKNAKIDHSNSNPSESLPAYEMV